MARSSPRFGGLLLGMVLARLLAPSDFGLYAVAIAATQFVMVVKDLGVIGATMHWRGQVDEMIPTASTLALVSATTIYLLFFVFAPTFASFAGNADAAPVVRLLTAVILVEAFTAVSSGMLMREFRQDRLVRANICGLMINAMVAISLAASGTGAMSFAAGQVAGAVVTGLVILLTARVPVRYGWDRLVAGQSPEIRHTTRSRTGVGGDSSQRRLHRHRQTPRRPTVGLLPPGIQHLELGADDDHHERSLCISPRVRVGCPNSMQRPSRRVRNVRMLRLYQVAVPISRPHRYAAVPLIAFLYGSEWLPAAPLLRYLSILTIVRVMISFAHDILMGAGSTKSMMLINGVWAIMLIPSLVVAVERFGIEGAAIAHAAVGLAIARRSASSRSGNWGFALDPSFLSWSDRHSLVASS